MQLLEQSQVSCSELNEALGHHFGRDSKKVISPITNKDRELYNRFFEEDSRVARYGNSWTYITQACRGIGSGLGLKYYDGDLLLSIGYHRGHYVIVRPLGRINERIIRLLKVLRSVSRKPVFLKKLFPSQVNQLRHFGNFKDAVKYSNSGINPEPGDYPWSMESFADDDTYPEIILDVNITLNYGLPPKEWFTHFKTSRINSGEAQSLEQLLNRYLRLRSKVNGFVRSGIGLHIIDFNIQMADEIRQFLFKHFGEEDKRNVEAYENMLTQLPLGNNGHSFFSFVAYRDGVAAPQGFFVTERLDKESAGLYAAVASRSCSGLSEYLHIEMLSRLQHKGIRLLNIGGSEIKSLHEFKLKFAPVEERYMKLVVYGAC